MKYKYIRANPAGNITGFIIGDIEREEWTVLGNKIIEEIDSTVEQVGIISEDFSRMDMMGGEFCGNATRSYALLKALEEGLTGAIEVEVQVSGATSPVEVEIDTDKMTSQLSLGDPVGTQWIDIDGVEYFLVKLEGIYHLILPGVAEDRDLVNNLMEILKEKYDEDAYGVMFYQDDGTMVPYVYVTEAETLIREGSCGSGTYSLGYYFQDLGEDEFTREVVQPGGTIELSLRDGRLTIGGEVSFGDLEEIDL